MPAGRRLVERGVRFVQLMSGAYVSIEDTWDAHADIVTNHRKHSAEVDKPIKGLIIDLKRRGLLDDTVVCGIANSAACRSPSVSGSRTTTPAPDHLHGRRGIQAASTSVQR